MQDFLKLFAGNVLEVIGLLLAIMWTFWAVYVLVMGVYRAHLSGRLGTVALILGLPIARCACQHLYRHVYLYGLA
jgi:hypothetical protein